MDLLIEITKRHFMASFKMLENILEKCPDDLWFNTNENDSIWKRLLHVLESIDYWFDDFDEYKFNSCFDKISAEMDISNPNELSKNEIKNYFGILNLKINNHFKSLNSIMLLDNSVKHLNVTHLDVILSQIRHIQINIGYCNEKFNGKDLKGIAWLGYNEES